jgi:hypothetical protein
MDRDEYFRSIGISLEVFQAIAGKVVGEFRKQAIDRRKSLKKLSKKINKLHLATCDLIPVEKGMADYLMRYNLLSPDGDKVGGDLGAGILAATARLQQAMVCIDVELQMYNEMLRRKTHKVTMANAAYSIGILLESHGIRPRDENGAKILSYLCEEDISKKSFNREFRRGKDIQVGKKPNEL